MQPSARLTVVICTHNRSGLLGRVLASLNGARRPADCAVELLVVANACTDDTASQLRQYESDMLNDGRLPLRWTQEPTPGKSHALNRAIPMIADGVVCFVDDDHRVDEEYLVNVVQAARRYPHATMFCGRILPDWDGREPRWVHDTGPYRIYPLPVPRYDEGAAAREITTSGPLPGGGNLSVRREVFDRIGGFSTQLGPHGHDLGGGEDSDFVQRCLAGDERIQYVPEILQFHYVDPERLRFGYLLRKGFQRTRSGIRIQLARRAAVPLYVWRKIVTYLLLAVLSLSWPRTRFYLVRLAAGLGELRGFLDKAPSPASSSERQRRVRPRAPHWAATAVAALFLTGLGLIGTSNRMANAVEAVFWVALVCTGALLAKSFYDFSQTGPPLKSEITRHYRLYSLYALGRLAFWAFAICVALASLGALVHGAAHTLSDDRTIGFWGAAVAGLFGLLLLTALQFCRHLLYLPGSIAASYHYRISRLYPLWRQLTPARLQAVRWLLGSVATLLFASSGWTLLAAGEPALGLGFLMVALTGPSALLALRWSKPGIRVRHVPAKSPNIVMIGSDTLRADRLGAAGYKRNVTPFIDSLGRKGTQFTSCYVPCARTAPSLVSMLTGTWPHHHGIRDNFIGDDETRLAVPPLAGILAKHGYRTAAISDWSGGDLGKFPLGFEILDLPADQWNIKYLVRQGPKDLRLFLSLFTHNRFGKYLLPELYYLAGVPLTSLVGRDARELISALAAEDSPFLLNVFVSTTHPPFGSEYPYYTLWSDRRYAGESKFVMARLTDPWEIIRRQGDSRKDFDLEQIIDLYDGCVRNFDDEVRRIVEHLSACGLADNTIVVVYSDHGMEFFEHDTWGQGNSVRGDFSARVPLVVADPRLRGVGNCQRIVRSIDLAPTLLDLLGLAVPSSMDGQSLVPYLKGTGLDMKLPAFNETGIWLTDVPGMPTNHLRYPNVLELLEVPDQSTGTLSIKGKYRQVLIAAKDRMVCLGDWKLIYQPTVGEPLYELFNLKLDPECRHNIAGAHPDIVSELRSYLETWISGSRRELTESAKLELLNA